MLTPLQLFRRLRDVVLRPRLERDLADEMAFHIEMETAANVRRGMTAADARRHAERDFGSKVAVAEEIRDARGISWLDELARDARMAVRSLRRQPGYALVSIATLALGIGATTATFGVVDGVLLRPLPFEASRRLAAVWEENADGSRAAVAAPNFADWRAATRRFEGLAAYRESQATVLGGREAVLVPLAPVSHEFFEVLRVAPVRGRTFTADESRAGGPGVVVVSDHFWRTQLGADPDLSRHALRLWGSTLTVVGVMPAGFGFPGGAELWVPLEQLDAGTSRTAHNNRVVGRLAEGATLADAEREMDAIVARVRDEHPTDNDAHGAQVVGLLDDTVATARTLLVLLGAAVGCVLLVACVNLAGAGLARNAARAREMAVRTALGAGRGRIVRQLLVEHVVLALAGGASGLLLAAWLVPTFLAFSPDLVPRAQDIRLDARVAAFALALSIVTGLVVGLLPALRAAGSDVRGSLAHGGYGSVGGARDRLRRGLVAVEVALALVLLVGSGLLARSFVAVLAERPGFDPGGVLALDVTLPVEEGPAGASPRPFHDAALARLATLEGVESVGLVNQRPLLEWGMNGTFEIEGREEPGSADYRVADSSYFRTMRIPLLAGRVFGAADDSASAHVTVVNRTLAERLWPGENPIGRRIRPLGMDSHPERWLTVIGVVGDVRHAGLGVPPPPMHYVHYRQRPERAVSATLVVRTRVAPQLVAARAREALRVTDPTVAVSVATMDDVVSRSLGERRFAMSVLAAFAALALGLAAVGIYGVLAFTVAQRTREIGVRMALGASRVTVLRMIVRDTVGPVLTGIVVGGAVAMAAGGLLRGMLYGVQPADARTFAGVVALLIVASAVACIAPTRRAVRVDPAIALRAD